MSFVVQFNSRRPEAFRPLKCLLGLATRLIQTYFFAICLKRKYNQLLCNNQLKYLMYYIRLLTSKTCHLNSHTLFTNECVIHSIIICQRNCIGFLILAIVNRFHHPPILNPSQKRSRYSVRLLKKRTQYVLFMLLQDFSVNCELILMIFFCLKGLYRYHIPYHVLNEYS